VTSMARKRIRVSRRMLFTWFMLAGFIFLFTPQNLTNKFQFAFAHIFRWPLSIGRNISLSARMQQPLADVVSRREYNLLQNYLANVIEQQSQEHQKIEKLSGLRNRLPLEGAKLVVADVITASIDASHGELIISRGVDDGLAAGQFVLGDNSVIGRISDVSSRTAKVKLITDPASQVEVKIAGLNVNRLMKGNGDNSARIQMLSTEHKVKRGDKVYTLKKPGFLDVSIITGTVARCKRADDHPSVWDITVEPVCEVESLNDVAVIIMNPKSN